MIHEWEFPDTRLGVVHRIRREFEGDAPQGLKIFEHSHDTIPVVQHPPTQTMRLYATHPSLPLLHYATFIPSCLRFTDMGWLIRTVCNSNPRLTACVIGFQVEAWDGERWHQLDTLTWRKGVVTYTVSLP